MVSSPKPLRRLWFRNGHLGIRYMVLSPKLLNRFCRRLLRCFMHGLVIAGWCRKRGGGSGCRRVGFRVAFRKC